MGKIGLMILEGAAFVGCLIALYFILAGACVLIHDVEACR